MTQDRELEKKRHQIFEQFREDMKQVNPECYDLDKAVNVYDLDETLLRNLLQSIREAEGPDDINKIQKNFEALKTNIRTLPKRTTKVSLKKPENVVYFKFFITDFKNINQKTPALEEIIAKHCAQLKEIEQQRQADELSHLMHDPKASLMQFIKRNPGLRNFSSRLNARTAANNEITLETATAKAISKVDAAVEAYLFQRNSVALSSLRGEIIPLENVEATDISGKKPHINVLKKYDYYVDEVEHPIAMREKRTNFPQAFLAVELEAYIERKEREIRQEKAKNPSAYKFKLFFANLIGYHEIAAKKLTAAKNLFNKITLKKDLPLSSDDVSCFKSGSLGSLMNRYHGTRAFEGLNIPGKQFTATKQEQNPAPRFKSKSI